MPQAYSPSPSRAAAQISKPKETKGKVDGD
jgi:hypothetical protein